MSSSSAKKSTPSRSLFPDGQEEEVAPNKKLKTTTEETPSPPADATNNDNDDKEEVEGIVVEEDGEDVFYEVDSIVGKKKMKGRVHYQVKWKGCEETTWEPISNLSDSAYADAQAFDAANKKPSTGKKSTGKKKAAKKKKKKTAPKEEEVNKTGVVVDDETKDTVEAKGSGAKKEGDGTTVEEKRMVDVEAEVKEIVEEIFEKKVVGKETVVEAKETVVEETATSTEETVEAKGDLDESTTAEHTQGVLGKVGTAVKNLITPKVGGDTNK